MQLELITYGNGPILDSVMTGVANIVTSPDYSVLAMTILGLATVLGIVGYHRDMAAYGIQAHSTWIIKGFTSLAIFWMLVGGSINVFIFDPLNNYNGVVDHVPMGIAMPVYLENQISENLSTLYSEWMAPSGYPSEFSYDNPSNGAGFYNPGMVSPLHAINVLTQAHFTDQYFYESLSDFTQNCLIPAMMLGVVDPNQFYIAGPGQPAPDDSIQDLLSTDMPNMPSGWTSVIYTSSNPGGTTYTCTNSWNTLNTDVNNMTAPNGALAGQYGGYLNTATGSNQTALADQALLGNAAGYMLGISTTGQQILGQAALMNSLSGPIAQFAQSTGTSSQAQAYALTQAFNQSENSWTTSAIMSAKMLPIFHLIMEMIVVAIFPLFFALAVVPTMTMKYLKLLFELLMWLALWSPLASVINFLVQSFMQSKVFNNVSSTAMSGISGFNYANYSFIAHNSITYTAVTGAIMWIIPVLAFGLVTGSAFVMSEAIGAVGSTAHGSAQSQGASVGTSSGLQGIEGQGSNLAKGQAFESQGKNWASADEKIAGMGGLDNLSNAGAFGNNLQANGFQKILNAKSNNMASNIGGGLAYGNMGTAEKTGMIGTEQTVGSRQGVATAAGLKGMTVESMSGQSAETNALQTQDSINNYAEHGINIPGMAQNIANVQGLNLAGSKGMTVKAQGNSALGSIRNETPLGQVMGNNFNGKYLEGGGNWEINGVLNRSQAERLYNSGLITGKAKTELGNALKSGEQAFNINAGGAGNSITGLVLSNKQGTVVAADGTYSNLMNKSIGSKSWQGDARTYDYATTNKSGVFFENPSYATNQAFLSNAPFLTSYQKFAPGTYNAATDIKNPLHKGAQATMTYTGQKTLAEYAGNSNKIEIDAGVTDKLIAAGGVDFLGNEIRDKVTATVGGKATTTMSVNALATSAGNQFTKLNRELNTGKINHAQWTQDYNATYAAYKTLIQAGAAPSVANGVNQLTNLMHPKDSTTKSTSPEGKKAISELNKHSGEF